MHWPSRHALHEDLDLFVEPDREGRALAHHRFQTVRQQVAHRTGPLRPRLSRFAKQSSIELQGDVSFKGLSLQRRRSRSLLVLNDITSDHQTRGTDACIVGRRRQDHRSWLPAKRANPRTLCIGRPIRRHLNASCTNRDTRSLSQKFCAGLAEATRHCGSFSDMPLFRCAANCGAHSDYQPF